MAYRNNYVYCQSIPTNVMRLFAYLLLILFPASLFAQVFGGNPPSLKWHQINTDTVRVIFPAGLEKQGRRVANIVNYLDANTRGSIGNRKRKVNIVLQNQTLESNGYVALGPFRSEFYLNPPPNPDLGSLKWEEQLSIHEYRHVLQNSNFDQGASKVLSYIFGQMGLAAATSIAVPNWFWEGDAVTMETALSSQGRGRLPSFFDGFRALSLENRNYSYMKMRNGSYVDYTPNHYPLGYLMSMYGREHYGRMCWKDITTDAVRYRGLFYPMSRSMKKHTGENVVGFYHKMLDECQADWNNYAKDSAVPGATLIKAPRTVTNYKYIYTIQPGQWIVYKDSYKTVAGFYIIDSTGHQDLVTRPGIQFDDYFGYKNGRLVWTEARYDPRWGWKDYSVIKLYDRATGKKKTLTKGTRYFSPDINAEGTKIIAAYSLSSQNFGLQLLDAANGKVIATLPNPQNWYYTYPKFSADEQHIISAVRNVKGEMAMVWQSISSGETELLTPFSFNMLSIPNVQHDTIYYTASYKDVDNIYALTLADKQLHQVTNHDNGVLHGTVEDRGVVFSGFTSKGYQLYTDSITWKPIDASVNYHSKWLRPDFQEGGDILSTVPDKDYKITAYRKSTKLINLHSWLPSFNDPDYSLTIYGDNILNTASTTLGYTYNRNEGSSALSGNLIYGALFPYLQGGATYTFNRSDLYGNRGRLYWNEMDVHGGITIPLTLSRGMYSRSISFSSMYHYLERYPQGNFKFLHPSLQYLGNSFVFYNARKKATQNLFTHFGQYLLLSYNHSLDHLFAEQFYGRFDLYLPGLSQNHNLILQAAFQQRDTMRNYSFSDNFSYARGYNKPYYKWVYKLGLNYHFPIAYPDWGFGQLLYFMRVRANLFYDYSRSYNYLNNSHNQYTSAGTEVFFDTKIGNVLPFSFGFRYSHLFDRDPADNAKDRFTFIIPIQQLFNY
ncbi:hypothetical protein SAMN05661012_00232 [Chitinophaga sancti]|uniref:WD40-like Beta Propeller Repeat n=2 Tax=Chitinophaga sancti TaxID=1004 RepID=A0A1K1LUY0_9BACT|nr:hypothetical protein SAMN05661012_00232 [Chitinophaga sancti]